MFYAMGCVHFLIVCCRLDFAGVYRCRGIDPYLNQSYTGTVVVTPQNTVYSLRMEYDTGEVAIGTGGQYDSYVDVSSFSRY